MDQDFFVMFCKVNHLSVKWYSKCSKNWNTYSLPKRPRLIINSADPDQTASNEAV